MQKWEYKVLEGYPRQSQLNELGEQGWELVVVVTGGGDDTIGKECASFGPQAIYCYLKRQK